MADAITLTLIDYDTINSQSPYWNIYPIAKEMLDANKRPQFYHIDMVIDTSTVTNATETTDPTNVVMNFTTPEQIYLRSDSALDTSLKIDVIGEKADGSFGQFTLTSDGADGTTPVDCGTWNFIATVIKNDAFAGNAIIDNDGIGGTVYFTAALGATATTAIVVIPTGYKASILRGEADLTGVPANNADGNFIEFGHAWFDTLTTTHVSSLKTDAAFVAAEHMRVTLKHYFMSAFTDMNVHLIICMWEA